MPPHCPSGINQRCLLSKHVPVLLVHRGIEQWAGAGSKRTPDPRMFLDAELTVTLEQNQAAVEQLREHFGYRVFDDGNESGSKLIFRMRTLIRGYCALRSWTMCTTPRSSASM
jgi:hypothetical protein